jgi:C-terminal processing protease CtpA/Prc
MCANDHYTWSNIHNYLLSVEKVALKCMLQKVQDSIKEERDLEILPLLSSSAAAAKSTTAREQPNTVEVAQHQREEYSPRKASDYHSIVDNIRSSNVTKMMDEREHDLEDGNVQLGKPQPFKDSIDEVQDTTTNNGRSYDSDEDLDHEQAGLMRNGIGSGYTRVRTNHQLNNQTQSSCCWIVCRGLSITFTLVAVGLIGFYIGQNQELLAYINGKNGNGSNNSDSGSSSSWFKPPPNNNLIVSNMDTKTYKELLQEAQIHNPNKVHTVRYNANAVLAEHPSSNPFDWESDAAPSVVTPPQIHQENSTPKPNGYLTHPHVVNNQLVFCAEGDAYVTHIQDGSKGGAMSAMKLTTTVGNVLDPKWHPTLPMLAYTATYSGRRDVYLLDLRGGASPSPMRLTYWGIGVGGVSGLIGWIRNDEASNGKSSYSLLFRAMSNDVSLPDYRLYLLHLDNNMNGEQAKKTGDLSETHAVLEIEPVPLAQAMDAARHEKCWYFVRYKQSSHTIRYVGGTAENLWRYCDGEASSGPLFTDDDYKGTSKDPQLYTDGNQQYLFFLSDRDLQGDKWVPDRMNIWALPLKTNKDAKYSTKDLIQITDTSCDFEGRTIREFSVDAVTGNVVVRIGADLYIMDQDTTQSKVNGGNRRLLESAKNATSAKSVNELEQARNKGGSENGAEEMEQEQPEVESVEKEGEDTENPADQASQEKIESRTDQPDAKQDENKSESTTDEVEVPIKTDEESNKTNATDSTLPSGKLTDSPAQAVVVDLNDLELDMNSTEFATETEPGPKYYYNYESPQLVARSTNQGDDDHFSGISMELTRLPIHVYSDFSNLQERILPVSILKHFKFGDVFDTVSQSVKMLLTLRGQLWVAPVVKDALPAYEESGRNLPARQYRVAPGAMMGGSTRIIAARHVPNPVEDGNSDRRLALVLATDPLTRTSEHAFYLIEVQPGVGPLFVDMENLPMPFLGGSVSGGSTREGGLGSVNPDTLVVSPCGNRMAWSDTDGRILVMTLPQYQQLDDSSRLPKFTILPQENELGEPMVGDEVDLTFSPGGRYLAIQHNARNQFQVISIADLGDPLSEENKIADINLGRIVQATPSRFNSVGAFWGSSPTEIHDVARDAKMAQLFGTKDPEDVSSTLYFLSDRDIMSDVSSPWGDRQKMPHFVASMAVHALPLKAIDDDTELKGQFRGDGGEEAHVKEILKRQSLLQTLLKLTTSASRRRLVLSGVFGIADDAFEKNDVDSEHINTRRLDSATGDEDSSLREAVFPKDMDIEFGPVDLTFARQSYRIANIPNANYVDILSQIPDDGSLVLIERDEGKDTLTMKVFLPDDFPSDQYDSKAFTPVIRKLAGSDLSTSRDYFYLVFAPDGAIRVVPNSLKGIAGLLSDPELDDSVVDHDGLHLSIWPSLEYRQMYEDAWRMLRDYFYDPDMTNIDWPEIHRRYLPLVERCSKREELDDVLIQMASELSALHVFVYGGEYNSPTHGDKALTRANDVGSLGASLKRSPQWKGYEVTMIPEADPDFTKIDQVKTIYSPLSHQSLRMSGQRGLQAGDIIVGVNGESVMRVPDIHMLFRGKAGKSVRLDVLRLASGPSPTDGNQTISDENEVAVEPLIVVPLSPEAADDLLYQAWEWKTHQMANDLATKAGISVGYVHLQDMSGPEAEDAFARGFFPNYHKQGFILDVRHNRGGNIDAWVLDVLQRKPWMYWQSRAFNPSNGGLGWDEHYAFRGHVVVLLDEKTSSDGEGVSRGISELGLGKLIGTRTWGGGIWLASDNHLVDGGIATAPEIGTYNEHMEWGLHIEQMGVDPDVVVDNDPHETFTGSDKQLERAIEELKKWLEEEPVVLPTPPEKKKDMSMGNRECKAL